MLWPELWAHALSLSLYDLDVVDPFCIEDAVFLKGMVAPTNDTRGFPGGVVPGAALHTPASWTGAAPAWHHQGSPVASVLQALLVASLR